MFDKVRDFRIKSLKMQNLCVLVINIYMHDFNFCSSLKMLLVVITRNYETEMIETVIFNRLAQLCINGDDLTGAYW